MKLQALKLRLSIIVQFSIPNMTAEQYNQVTMDLKIAGKANIPERLDHVQ